MNNLPGKNNKTFTLKIDRLWYDEERNKRVLQDMANELRDRELKTEQDVAQAMRDLKKLKKIINEK